MSLPTEAYQAITQSEDLAYDSPARVGAGKLKHIEDERLREITAHVVDRVFKRVGRNMAILDVFFRNADLNIKMNSKSGMRSIILATRHICIDDVLHDLLNDPAVDFEAREDLKRAMADLGGESV